MRRTRFHPADAHMGHQRLALAREVWQSGWARCGQLVLHWCASTSEPGSDVVHIRCESTQENVSVACPDTGSIAQPQRYETLGRPRLIPALTRPECQSDCARHRHMTLVDASRMALPGMRQKHRPERPCAKMRAERLLWRNVPSWLVTQAVGRRRTVVDCIRRGPQKMQEAMA
jgi:hypothetical protein